MRRSRPRHQANQGRSPPQPRPAEPANKTGYSIRKALCTHRFDR